MCFPVINLGKNFCRNYLWKILVTQAAVWKIFLQICVGVIDKLAPEKKKYNRGNNIAFMNKPLARAHMKRSGLQNRFLKNRSKSTESVLSSNAIIL